MKKVSSLLISAALFWGMIKLLQKTKDNHQVFTQREQEMGNQVGAGYEDDEIASFLRSSQKTFNSANRIS